MNVLLFPLRLTLAPRTALLLAAAAALLAVGGHHRRVAPASTVPAAARSERTSPAMDPDPARAANPLPPRPTPASDANATRETGHAGSPAAGSTAAAFADLSADPDASRAWARQDPSAAIRWLGGAAPGERRDAVLEIVCAEIAADDPAEAVALAETYSAGNRPLLENLVSVWAEQDPAAALAYARTQPAGELRSRLLARTAVALARTDPAAAATLVLADMTQTDLRDEALIAIVHRWARHDASSAAAWIERWPAGDLRARALGELP